MFDGFNLIKKGHIISCSLNTKMRNIQICLTFQQSRDTAASHFSNEQIMKKVFSYIRIVEEKVVSFERKMLQVAAGITNNAIFIFYMKCNKNHNLGTSLGANMCACLYEFHPGEV